jgi:hypothetical protein
METSGREEMPALDARSSPHANGYLGLKLTLKLDLTKLQRLQECH